MPFYNYYSTLVIPSALSPDNGMEVSLYWPEGQYYGYYDFANGTLINAVAKGMPRVMRKSFWEAMRDFTDYPSYPAGTFDSVVFPEAYYGRANIFGELRNNNGSVISRIIKKKDPSFDWALANYLEDVSGKTGGKLSAGPTVPVTEQWDATISIAAPPGVQEARCIMRDTRVCHYPISNLLEQHSYLTSEYQIIKPHGFSGGTFASVSSYLGHKQYDLILSAYPEGVSYIPVDVLSTYDDEFVGTSYLWSLRVANVYNHDGSDCEAFAIDIPSVTWKDNDGNTVSGPPNFNPSDFSIVYGRLPGRGVLTGPKLVRKKTGTNTNSAIRSRLTVGVQHRDKVSPSDPIPLPVRYPCLGEVLGYTYSNYAYLTARAIHGKALPETVWSFYYKGPGDENGPTSPDTYYRVSCGGQYVTDYFQRAYGTRWDWTGVNDDDMMPIFVIEFLKITYEDNTFDYSPRGQYEIYPYCAMEYLPMNIPRVGLPVLFAKTSGIKNLESNVVTGETLTWSEYSDVEPENNIPTTITASAQRFANRIDFTLDDITALLKPDHDPADYVFIDNEIQFHVFAYVGSVLGYAGIDCTMDRINKLANNNYYDPNAYAGIFKNFADLEFIYNESAMEYQASASKPLYDFDASAELRIKLGLIFCCKFPHRSSRPYFYHRRECIVIIPAN